LDNSEAKLKDLQKFLRKNGINHKKIEVDRHQSVLHYDDNIYVSTRSGYYQKYQDLGISDLAHEMIKKYLLEITCAAEFEQESLIVKKRKANSLLVKDAHTIKDSKLEVLIVGGKPSFGGYTASRKQICIFDPPDEPIDEYLRIAPGIGYHELGHVLFTCSWKRLAKDIKERYPDYDDEADTYTKNEMQQAVQSVLSVVNALEDPRMENLMGNRYGACIPYFKSTIYNFLLSSIQEKVDMGERVTAFDCALIAGRKYVSFEHRRWVFDRFMECDEEHTEEAAKRVNMYINKFITLSWRKNRKEMIDLSMGFFFEFVKPEMEKQGQGQSPSTWGDMIDEMLQGMGSGMNEIGEHEDGDIDESEEKMLQKVMRDILGEQQTQSSSGKEGDKKEENKKATKKGGVGDGSTDHEGDNKVREAMADSKNQVDEEIKKNVNHLKHKMKKSELDNKTNKKFDDKPVTVAMKKDERILEKKFKEFMRKCRNGYETRRKKGGVDIGEARRQQYRGGTRIFRQYRRDVKKALDIDVAFCLDCSYSMSSGYDISNIDEASRQLWIAATACKAVGANVKIFTFTDYDLGTLEMPKTKSMYRCPYYINGTTISDTMYKAENYLNCSKANTKWFVALTDGCISDVGPQNQILTRMKRDNITCGKINLIDGDWGHNANGDSEYDHVLDMNHDGRGSHNTMDKDNIVTFFKKIYEVSMNKEGLV